MDRTERWQRLGLRLMMLLSLWCVGALAVRAVVTSRARSAAEAMTRDQVQEWHWQIGEDMPIEQRREWQEISRGNPELMLRVCSLERVGRDVEE